MIVLVSLSETKAEEKDSLQKPVFGIVYASDINFYSLSILNTYLKNNSFELLSDNIQIYYSTIGIYLKNTENSRGKVELLFDIPLKYKENFSKLILYDIKSNYSYNLVNSKIWEISPFIGAGVKTDILIIKHSNQSSSISNSNLEETFYRKDNFDINLGLEICRVINIRDFVINVSIMPAYKLNLGDPKWYNDSGNNVSSIPNFRTSCFYLTVKSSLPLTTFQRMKK